MHVVLGLMGKETYERWATNQCLPRTDGKWKGICGGIYVKFRESGTRRNEIDEKTIDRYPAVIRSDNMLVLYCVHNREYLE